MIKVQHGGEFSENKKDYIGGEVNYFDMCSSRHFYTIDIESMLEEIGLHKGYYEMWFCIVGDDFSVMIIF